MPSVRNDPSGIRDCFSPNRRADLEAGEIRLQRVRAVEKDISANVPGSA